MKREQLEHALRAAARIVDQRDFLAFDKSLPTPILYTRLLPQEKKNRLTSTVIKNITS